MEDGDRVVSDNTGRYAVMLRMRQIQLSRFLTVGWLWHGRRLHKYVKIYGETSGVSASLMRIPEIDDL
jgi:hypothetical protein